MLLSGGFPIRLMPTNVSGREVVPPDYDSDDVADFRDLIEGLAQELSRQDEKDILANGPTPTPPTPGMTKPLSPLKVSWTTSSLLKVPSGGNIVLVARRSGDKFVEAVLTSCEVKQVATWFEACLRRWHVQSPQRFPRLDWHKDPAWSTAPERTLREEIETKQREKAQAIVDYDRQIDELDKQLLQASAEAAIGDRRLLSAQGDALVAAVLAAFEQLGFEVDDKDKIQEEIKAGELLEDLVVRDLDNHDWVALVEVKGKLRHASSNEMSNSFLRSVERFVQANNRPPDAKWFVVNSENRKDAAERVVPLDTSERDVVAFGEHGGSLIWAVTLFRLIRDVEEGRIPPATARSWLINSVGRFQLGKAP